MITLTRAKIALLAQSLHNSHLKRTFLQSFADDPAKFIQTWLESQSRDLESVLGAGASEGLTLRQEELRRSEFFRLPWVEEVCNKHVSRYPSLIVRLSVYRLCLFKKVFAWLRRACNHLVEHCNS